jgi:hypothetical protein
VFLPFSCLYKATRLHQVAEQSDDPGTIEAALEQAKRLRVDPDLISSAEGILDRRPDVSLELKFSHVRQGFGDAPESNGTREGAELLEES